MDMPYHKPPCSRPPQHPLHFGNLNYTAEQINALLGMIPFKADRAEVPQMEKLSDVNYLGHVTDASLLPNQTQPSWALVGSLKQARPYFYYVEGFVPKGYVAGWNDVSTVLGTYDLTADKVSIYDFHLLTEYNVSRNHTHTTRVFSKDWNITWEYYPEFPDYLAGLVYQPCSKVNVPGYKEHSFVSNKPTKEPPFTIVEGTNEFSWKEAVNKVPEEYRFPGMKVTFISSMTHLAETWYFKGGTWENVGNWQKIDFGVGEDQITAEEAFREKFEMPKLTADMAIADEHGNRIPDTYVRREAVTNYIRSIYNELFVANPPLITDGYITPEMLSEEVRILLENTGQSITNLPDGEDLQSVHGVLKFANKEYNPNSYDGLGRIFIRRNIVNGVNTLAQSQVNWAKTLYIIRYDHDLQGKTITIPEGCTLTFESGKIYNGTIILNNTLVRPYGGNLKDYIDCRIEGSFRKGQVLYSEEYKQTVVWTGEKWKCSYSVLFRVFENKLQQSVDDGETWENVSDYIASYFRFEPSKEDPNSIGKIQISRDNVEWIDLSPDFTNYLRIADYVGSTSELPHNPPLGVIYGVSSDQQAGYELYVYTSKGWVNNGKFTSIAVGLVQDVGDNENVVMSQAAVTRKLSELGSKISETSIANGVIKESLEPIILRENIGIKWEDSTELSYSGYNRTQSVTLKKGDVIVVRAKVSTILAALYKTQTATGYGVITALVQGKGSGEMQTYTYRADEDNIHIGVTYLSEGGVEMYKLSSESFDLLMSEIGKNEAEIVNIKSLPEIAPIPLTIGYGTGVDKPFESSVRATTGVLKNDKPLVVYVPKGFEAQYRSGETPTNLSNSEYFKNGFEEEGIYTLSVDGEYIAFNLIAKEDIAEDAIINFIVARDNTAVARIIRDVDRFKTLPEIKPLPVIIGYGTGSNGDTFESSVRATTGVFKNNSPLVVYVPRGYKVQYRSGNSKTDLPNAAYIKEDFKEKILTFSSNDEYIAFNLIAREAIAENTSIELVVVRDNTPIARLLKACPKNEYIEDRFSNMYSGIERNLELQVGEWGYGTISSDGSETDNTDFIKSDFIDVSGVDLLRININQDTELYTTISLYDNNKQFQKRLAIRFSSQIQLNGNYKDNRSCRFIRIVANTTNPSVLSISFDPLQSKFCNRRLLSNKNIKCFSHAGSSLMDSVEGGTNLPSSMWGTYLNGFDGIHCNVRYTTNNVGYCLHDESFVDEVTGDTITLGDVSSEVIDACRFKGQPLAKIESVIYLAKMLGLDVCLYNVYGRLDSNVYNDIISLVKKYGMFENVYFGMSNNTAEGLAYIDAVYSAYPKAKILLTQSSLTSTEYSQLEEVLRNAMSVLSSRPNLEVYLWINSSFDAPSLERLNIEKPYNVKIGCFAVTKEQEPVVFPYIDVYTSYSGLRSFGISRRDIEVAVTREYPEFLMGDYGNIV